MAYYFQLGLMLVASIGVLWAVQCERREWNNGICRKNGLPWRNFDCCTGGDRGYQAGDETCWISYDVDKGEIQPEIVIVKDEQPC